ncbi:MAG TPA: protein-disulfide reductase DsbD family protein [Ferruginibacter sp.]|nr:protein-disulfide reductase DsbD family protein [Ferruginibacter sp.]HMP21084.1 protein-disulfide reductase DsbD family protein [Ferruginibacter sp.]
MKKFLTTLLAVGLYFFTTAQINNPVKWVFTAKKIGPKTYELHITATLDAKWHIYAQDAGEGPEPTTVSFSKNPLVLLDGKVKELGKLEKSFDPNFNSVLKYYADNVDFVQVIKLKSEVPTVVKGSITYMVCNDRQCLPPKEVPFTIKVGGK